MVTTTNIHTFDWEYYINTYPDLRNANINTKEKAYKHWITNGRKEGRLYRTLEEHPTHERLSIHNTIENAYKTLLLRAPDPKGYNYFYSLMTSGALDKNQLITAIKSSDEYTNLTIGNTISTTQRIKNVNTIDLKKIRRSNVLNGLKIKYIGHLGNSGYCDWTKEMIFVLLQHGAQIELECVSTDADIRIALDKCCDSSNTNCDELLKQKVLFNLLNNALDNYNIVIIQLIADAFPRLSERERKKNKDVVVYGMTTWEADRIPVKWAEIINAHVDHLIVPCEWNREVFSKDVTKPIHVVHCIVNETEQVMNKCVVSGGDDYIFYTIGHWTARKRIDLLIRAYLSTFSKNDHVTLFIKTFLVTYSQEEKQVLSKHIDSIVSEFPNPARIIYNLDSLSDSEINTIHQRSHCFISPCTSEGIGLGAATAAMMGKRVIITGYGGQLDYLKGVDLIDHTIVAANMCGYAPYDCSSCCGGCCVHYPQYDAKTQQWAAANFDHMCFLMRGAYEGRLSGKEETRQYLLNNFNGDKVIDQFLATFSLSFPSGNTKVSNVI